MATHFGYFTVIEDPNETTLRLTRALGGDVDKKVDFDLPSDTHTSDRGVLTFRTDAVSPNNLTYTIDINDVPATGHRVDSSVLHSEQKVVKGFKRGPNTLGIKLTGGTGTLEISEIVLHYVRFS
jgi:hypothetical protein